MSECDTCRTLGTQHGMVISSPINFSKKDDNEYSA